MKRRIAKEVKVGNITIGGDAPVSIQSMTKTDTCDVEATVTQIKELEAVGCELIRVAVPDIQAAKKLGEIVRQISIPLIADIHFDYRLALMAIKQGVSKLRINPGNIRKREQVKEVVQAAKERKVPIRIGVNAGSLDRKKYQELTPANLVASALDHIKVLEDLDFTDIIISLKASDIPITIESYRLMATKVDYPFHIGITEAGPPKRGSIKSAVGIGSLLALGIGDTLRVSLTGDPVEEVKVGCEILKALGLRPGLDLISCPTCGRCKVNLIEIVEQIEEEISRFPLRGTRFCGSSHLPFKVAVMGCVVNGPGEAKEADIGLAAGDGVGLIFRKGEIIKKVKEKEMVEALIKEIKDE